MTACRTCRMRIQKFIDSKLRILLFLKHQTFLESVKYWWNEKQMKLVTFFKNFHGFHEKQYWVSNVVLSWRVSWKTNFSMRKSSTLSGSHFTTICSILKSFGVLKRSGFEFFIFVNFTCVCKTCDMQSCNSSVEQNEHYLSGKHWFSNELLVVRLSWNSLFVFRLKAVVSCQFFYVVDIVVPVGLLAFR